MCKRNKIKYCTFVAGQLFQGFVSFETMSDNYVHRFVVFVYAKEKDSSHLG